MIITRPIVDALIRRKFRQQLRHLAMDRFRIGIAHTAEEHQDAFGLVRAAYVYRGIQAVRGDTIRVTGQHVLPEATVFVAHEGEQIVGTMTVTLDSPAGLPIDHEYREPLDRLRAQGSRLTELGSLAVIKRCCGSGVTTLLNMAAHWFSLHVLEATHCVVGVNPKASALYRAIYAFRQLAGPQHHAELEASVQGLYHELAWVRPHLERYFRCQLPSGALAHEHFTERLPACVALPPLLNLEDLARWKLPRSVFQQLFVDETNRIAALDPRIRHHLEGWRSLRTLARSRIKRAS